MSGLLEARQPRTLGFAQGARVIGSETLANGGRQDYVDDMESTPNLNSSTCLTLASLHTIHNTISILHDAIMTASASWDYTQAVALAAWACICGAAGPPPSAFVLKGLKKSASASISSRTMSNPPIKSPLVYNCGKVGHSEYSFKPCRTSSSASMLKNPVPYQHKTPTSTESTYHISHCSPSIYSPIAD